MRFSISLLFLACGMISPMSAAIGVKKVTDGFNRPVWVGVPKVSKKQLWVMEQHGVVTAVDPDSGQKVVLFDIHENVSRKGNEEGLLGLAFSPDFDKTGRFYLNYTDKEHYTCITRMVFQNGKVDARKEEIILRYKQDFQNHNGGWIEFGPDKMLYIGNGDGGSGNDPKQRAQDLTSLLGKILRIDVSPAKGYEVPSDNPFVKDKDAKPEIWAYGVRNPWRCSFDAKTGDLWIGDVGQNHWEEISHIEHKKGFGANFGWRLREGDVATPANNVGGDKPKDNVDPVYVYKHGGGSTEGFSVTGGYVYRGPIKELQGRYIFADYQNPRIWSFVEKNGKATDFKDHTAELQPEGGKIKQIPSFGEGPDGTLFIVDHSGAIYQVVEK
jgi:glucose/arabinose dehydrogenase